MDGWMVSLGNRRGRPTDLVRVDLMCDSRRTALVVLIESGRGEGKARRVCCGERSDPLGSDAQHAVHKT